MTETLDPLPGSRPGHAELPAPDAVISVYALRVAPVIFSSCRLAPVNSSNVNNDLNLETNSVLLYLSVRVRANPPSAALRKEGDRPTIATRFRVLLRFPGWGVFPEA
jgi:hypothetical protein